MRPGGLSDASKPAEVKACKPVKREFGVQMGKSRGKRPALAAASGIVMAVTLAGAAAIWAENPPQAPAPKPDAAAGASAPPQADSRVILRANPTLVVLPVTVKDSSGRLVPDLTKEEFRVLDDNVEQRVSFFTVEGFPLSAVVLIDNDLKGKDSEMVESSLKSIVAGLSLTDEAFVCRFDVNFHPGKGFTKDQDKLVTELKRTRLDTETDVVGPDPSGPFAAGATINGQNISGGPATPPSTKILKNQPTKALDDAVYEAAGLFSERGRDPRKTIFLVSEGRNT